MAHNSLCEPEADHERARHLTLDSILTDYNAILDSAISDVLIEAERESQRMGRATLPIYDILRYHLGFKDEHFQDARGDGGKRVRPFLCLLSCAAAGGAVERAVPMAAAIELLHNFTLIHDDIQDRSDLRRHRPTVWNLWGTAQAINAGDAMFAVAHLALARSQRAGVDPATVLALSSMLHQTTLRIVEGQVMDLGFEDRMDVSVDEYMEMIGGKSAAITRCACWAGAAVANADRSATGKLAEFGFSLGVGFQLQDDVLGTEGATIETGKPPADDIVKRKKSLPVLMLLEHADAIDQERVRSLYSSEELTQHEVQQVLDLLTKYEIRSLARERVREWHDRSQRLLETAVPPSNARAELSTLVESLAERTN